MLSLLSVMLCSVAASAQHKVEMIPFGNMDQWIDRQIKESGIIGGATKNVFAIGPTATITENKAYTNMGGSPWATSNVMARVAGITKTNTSVFPEKRGDPPKRAACPPVLIPVVLPARDFLPRAALFRAPARPPAPAKRLPALHRVQLIPPALSFHQVQQEQREHLHRAQSPLRRVLPPALHQAQPKLRLKPQPKLQLKPLHLQTPDPQCPFSLRRLSTGNR